jgi:DNA-binding response OmpR family regulator
MDTSQRPPFLNPGSSHQAGPPSPCARILVVDDDADLRQLNASLLKHSGYEVTTAEDGAAALAALDADSYDLLLTDHNMPKLTGIELLNQLHIARKTLPTILVSGSLTEDELYRYPWLQIAATLLKPYAAADLLRTVRRVLSSVSAGAPGVGATIARS